MNQLLQVGLRQKALYIPAAVLSPPGDTDLSETTLLLVANLAKLGFGLSEPALRALDRCSTEYQNRILEQVREVMRVNKNWLPWSKVGIPQLVSRPGIIS
nr:hypothetical protein [Haliscomenobacter sp.]